VSTIVDQSDLFFTMTGSFDPFTLSAKVKFRVGRKPPDRSLGFRVQDGVVILEAVEGTRAPSRQASLRERLVYELVDDVRRDDSWSRSKIADALGVEADDKTLQRALRNAVQEHEWTKPQTGQYAPPPE
jgi:hypothetical protein